MVCVREEEAFKTKRTDEPKIGGWKHAITATQGDECGREDGKKFETGTGIAVPNSKKKKLK
jgi:hypothetical protein